MYLETAVPQSAAYFRNFRTAFSSSYINVSRIQKFQNLNKSLAGIVASANKCQFFGNIRCEILVDVFVLVRAGV